MKFFSLFHQLWCRLALLLMLMQQSQFCCGIQWLGLKNYTELTEGRLQASFFCSRMLQLQVFNKRQFKFCKRVAVVQADTGAVTALIKSAHRTVDECQKYFKHFRWDCSVLRHVPELAPELKSLTAEQALVHALAGLTLSTTFAEECSRGSVRRCGCGREPSWLALESPESRFKFEGCHTNIRMGQRLASKFLAAPAARNRRRRNRISAGSRGGFRQFVRMINAYNYKVGINMSRLSETVSCMCHGSSVSCTIRTCHKVLHGQKHVRRLALFRRYNKNPMDALMEMYDKKLRKTVYSESGYMGYEEPCSREDRVSNPLRAEPKCETFKVVSGLPKQMDSLLFHEHSLDYCHMREGRFPGTQNRECLPDGSPAAQSIMQSHGAGQKRREIVCSVMCCGRPYRNVTETHVGTHDECKASSCRLQYNPFEVVCEACQLNKSYCT